MVLFIAAATWQTVARLLSLPTLHSSDLQPDSWARGDVRHKLASVAGQSHVAKMWRMRRTYPYSVIPGGVRDVQELRETIARDFVVRRHYAHFNFERAEMIRAREARLVYMSYRRGDAVFWTRKKIRLNADELLLTDGVITARARCGNQISETPQPDVASEEPEEATFDLPVASFVIPAPPFPLRSLLAPTLPIVAASEPPTLFAGNFNFPFVPLGGGGNGSRKPHVCESPHQEQLENALGIDDDESSEKICKHHHKAPTVPEPSTLLLISSGLAALAWRYRHVSLS